jgi:tetratricopeptide (TPR) repeat protein
MNLDKLKESARRFEQKEDWRRAIEVYRRALGELETQGDPVPDPSVYNRVGDLQMKVSDIHGAVHSYEQALELYADQGFFNNAIALGGKILRVDPGRTSTYLRLAQLHARKNVVPDVRRNLGDYLERMAREHHLPKAIEALRGFAERFCRDAEMRAVVADLLAHVAPGAESGKALDALLSELRNTQETGDGGPGGAVPHVRGLVFLDTDPDWTPGSSEAGLSASGGVERVEGLNTVQDTLGEVDPGLQIEGLESAEFAPPEELDIERMDDLAQDESTFGDGIAVVSPDDLIQLDDLQDDPALGLIGGAEPPVEPVPLVSLGSPDVDRPPDGPALVVLDDEVDDDLLLDFEAEEAPFGASAEAPGAGRGHHTVAQPAADPVAATEARLAGHERAEAWGEALDVAAELVRLQPDSIPRYQKQVELAYLAGDRDGLTARYLELGDALLRSGMRAPAVAVYRRVLEHEPGHPRALGALASLGVAVELPAAAAPAAPPPPRQEYVDLGALILDDQPARDSRMRVESAEPTAPDDEDRTFREILDQFKRGIEENLDSEDFQAHYDLGIAFKEMGLLDEAIAQFQRALRWPEGRLKASEALGIAFHDKGRHAIAEAVLSRAIEGLPGTDDAKIGLIYWLGRALEAQGKEPAALGWYERALAVDIRFLDLADRIGRLGAGSSS